MSFGCVTVSFCIALKVNMTQKHNVLNTFINTSSYVFLAGFVPSPTMKKIKTKTLNNWKRYSHRDFSLKKLHSIIFFRINPVQLTNEINKAPLTAEALNGRKSRGN